MKFIGARTDDFSTDSEQQYLEGRITHENDGWCTVQLDKPYYVEAQREHLYNTKITSALVRRYHLCVGNTLGGVVGIQVEKHHNQGVYQGSTSHMESEFISIGFCHPY